jgi:proline racemase
VSIRFARTVSTVDSHTEGNPTRVIVGGVPVPPGQTLLEKRAWLRRHGDGIRRMLNFEPRGGGMMCSVLLLPPDRADSDFSVVIMEQDEYVPMCGHCIIGTATTVVATGMVAVNEPVTRVRFDTPAGTVVCDVAVEHGEIGAVAFENVESFLWRENVPLDVENLGRLAVDIAYGGDFYAIINADRLGLALRPDNEVALIAAWRRIAAAIAEQVAVVHPDRPDIDACYQVLFTSRHSTRGDVMQTILCPPGSLDRSPCGTGTCARLALMFSRGEITINERRRFEGILGTCFTGEIIRTDIRAGYTYVTPRVSGRAYITGFHQFVIDPEDPLPEGFRIGSESRDPATARGITHRAAS